jgi:undecaprenyl-diphosphatase
MTSLIEHILSLSGWVALLIVFAVPALEASVFLGFVFPGETALILGGVLASYGRVTLWAVFLAGISGAVIGDSVGYLVGREYGARMLQATRFHRLVKPHRIERAQDYLARRGGRAVFFGRFTAALRVLVPGLAGMARMSYRVFLPFNVAGGAIWGATMIVLGYVAGASWKHVARYATDVGIALFLAVVLALILGHLLRTARDPQSWAGRQTTRLAGSRPASWLRRRFPGQLRWLAARFHTGGPTGFALTVAVLTLAACAWSLGSLTFSVVHHINSQRCPPHQQRPLRSAGPGLLCRPPHAVAHRPCQGAHLARLGLRALAGRDRRRPGTVAVAPPLAGGGPARAGARRRRGMVLADQGSGRPAPPARQRLAGLGP